MLNRSHSRSIAFQIQRTGMVYHVMRGAPREEIQFFATWGELEHPREGTILFDTGYTSRFHDLTRGFPNSIYARMTAVDILQVEEAKAEADQKKKKLTLKQRWKKACNTDNIIDFSVDVGLIAFDVLSSPILIVVRIFRWMMNKWVNGYIKRFLKWFVHKVLRIK